MSSQPILQVLRFMYRIRIGNMIYQLRDIESGKLQKSLKGPASETITSVAFSPTNKHQLVSGCAYIPKEQEPSGCGNHVKVIYKLFELMPSCFFLKALLLIKHIGLGSHYS